MKHRLVSILAALALLLAMRSPATAGPTAAQKCEATKLKLVCKKTCCELAIAAKGGTAFTKCTNGFSAGFGKIKGTCGVGEPILEAKVDAFRTDATTELNPASNKCEAGKLKAVCKKVCCELDADAKGVVKGGTADFTTCKGKFSGTFGKLETKGGCATSSDATAIENKVDAFTTDVFTEVTAPGGTTTTSTSSTTTTSTSTTTTTAPTCANGGIPCAAPCGSGCQCVGPQGGACGIQHGGGPSQACVGGVTGTSCCFDSDCGAGKVCILPTGSCSNPFNPGRCAPTCPE